MNHSKHSLSAQQKAHVEIWERHLEYEFKAKNLEDTIKTMVPDAYVNHIPTMTGGQGHTALRKFYGTYFIPHIPRDMENVSISRTIGEDQLVDELISKFTHDVEIPWMLPGIAPTGKYVECPLVVIVRFREGKLAHEHIYWDQACILVQLGLLDEKDLPIVGKKKLQEK